MKKELQEIIDKERIDSKGEYYLLYEAGFLGNKPKTWNSIDEIIRDEWEGKVCIRGKNKFGFKTKYNQTIKQVQQYLNQLQRKKINLNSITFNQSLPDNYLTIQGEVMRTEKHFYVIYSTIKKPMKIALAEKESYLEGRNALSLMKRTFDPATYDDINELFDLFPESIIEFSSYSINVGELPHRNTIIWEVRNY